MAKILITTEIGEMNAPMTKGYLESMGISAFSLNALSPSPSFFYPIVSQSNSIYQIYVQEKDAPKAQALLTERKAHRSQSDE